MLGVLGARVVAGGRDLPSGATGGFCTCSAAVSSKRGTVLLMSRIYITTPLYYVNAAPHIGHAYSTVAADCLARYHRLNGDEVYLLTGTDEHGQKIAQAARERGMAPQAFVDEVVRTFQDLWRQLGIAYDDFIRTTEPRHVETVQAILTRLHEDGKLHRFRYASWYCTPCETFWTLEELRAAGAWDEAAQQGSCPSCQRPVATIEEDTFNLALEAARPWLRCYVQEHPAFIQPEVRRNEILSLLECPLPEYLCLTRDRNRVPWGIGVPFSDQHVVYVWFDALINYISAIGYGREPERFARWWPAAMHLIGKDILRHHAIYWPIMLHALGFPDDQMPRQVFAHGWWLVGQSKMSKSVGNVVNPADLARRYGADALRYFLLRETPFGADGSFTEEALVQRINSDLANDLGNLLQRSLHIVEQSFGGILPPLAVDGVEVGGLARAGAEISAAIQALPRRLSEAMGRRAFDAALDAIWTPIRAANHLLDDCKPWTMVKRGDTQGAGRVLAAVAVTLRSVVVALSPVMPSITRQMWQRLGEPVPFDRVRIADLASVDLLHPERSLLAATGMRIERGAPLFPRIA